MANGKKCPNPCLIIILLTFLLVLLEIVWQKKLNYENKFKTYPQRERTSSSVTWYLKQQTQSTAGGVRLFSQVYCFLVTTLKYAFYKKNYNDLLLNIV